MKVTSCPSDHLDCLWRRFEPPASNVLGYSRDGVTSMAGQADITLFRTMDVGTSLNSQDSRVY